MCDQSIPLADLKHGYLHKTAWCSMLGMFRFSEVLQKHLLHCVLRHVSYVYEIQVNDHTKNLQVTIIMPFVSKRHLELEMGSCCTTINYINELHHRSSAGQPWFHHWSVPVPSHKSPGPKRTLAALVPNVQYLLHVVFVIRRFPPRWQHSGRVQ